jgi:hypothetical protein
VKLLYEDSETQCKSSSWQTKTAQEISYFELLENLKTVALSGSGQMFAHPHSLRKIG